MAWGRWVHRMRNLGVGLTFSACALAALPSPAAPADWPTARSTARLPSIATLSGGAPSITPCLTPWIETARYDPLRSSAAARRAVASLAADVQLAGERRLVDADGTLVRFSGDRGPFERIDLSDENGNGRPDIVDTTLAGISDARRVLVGQLGLPGPNSLEVILARLGPGVEGFVLAGGAPSHRTQIWLDASGRGGATALRRAAEHQFGHAVAGGAGLDSSWGEALATWTAISIEGEVDDRSASAISRRLSTLSDGLNADTLDLAAGNAAWFAFLDEAFGPTAVKLAVEEIGRGGNDRTALDRALRRGGGGSFEGAFREFHLWSILVGPRDDRRHYSFAPRLAAPSFAATADALPALSIQGDPGIASGGAAAVLIRPGERSGGLTLRFEGDLTARWAADLLIVHNDGGLHRLAITLDAEDAGEVTVPLHEVRETILMVRNLESAGRAPRRYSWAAHFEAGYPAEIGALHVESAGPDGGALVSWETSSERGVLGFNVLRAAADGLNGARINPVWIPAVGDASGLAAYQFLDASAQPGSTYTYRVEAVTPEGLSSRSDSVPFHSAP